MHSNLVITNDKVYIENIPRMEWGKGTDISFIRSAQLALNALGGNYTYDFLMGISGAAFRLHFQPDWCPSAGDVTTGFDVSKVLFNSLGYACELYKIDDNSFDDIRAVYRKIITQINLGKPIIAINLKECPEWGIITGYLKNQPGLLCRTYFDHGDEYSLAEHAPWLSFFIGEKSEAIGCNELFNNSLKIAVQLARTDEFDQYKSGFNAFESWIEELKRYVTSEKPQNFDQQEVNLTMLYYLLDARQAADRYLAFMNKNIKMKRGVQIIDCYKKEVELLSDARKNKLPSFNAIPDDWTEEVLYSQIEILSQVLKIEKETIQLIEEELEEN